MRRMISFKVENLPPKEHKIVDDWANSQGNIQQSLANIIMHVVRYVGNEDVMDFDIQRKLHTIFSNEPKEDVIASTVEPPNQMTLHRFKQGNGTGELPNGIELFDED